MSTLWWGIWGLGWMFCSAARGWDTYAWVPAVFLWSQLVFEGVQKQSGLPRTRQALPYGSRTVGGTFSVRLLVDDGRNFKLFKHNRGQRREKIRAYLNQKVKDNDVKHGIVEALRETDLAPLQIHLYPNEFPKPTRQTRRVVPKAQAAEESKLPNPLLLPATFATFRLISLPSIVTRRAFAADPATFDGGSGISALSSCSDRWRASSVLLQLGWGSQLWQENDCNWNWIYWIYDIQNERVVVRLRMSMYVQSKGIVCPHRAQTIKATI